MSWSSTRTQIETLMTTIGFTRAPEVFDIEKQPATFNDCVFCIQVEDVIPNSDGFGNAADRFYPTEKIRISAMYNLFAGSQDAYNCAIKKNDQIIDTLINPNNRPDDVRKCDFVNSKPKLFDKQGNWLIVDNYFDLQVQVSFI